MNSPILCCHDQDQSLSQNQAQTPPNIRHLQNQTHQSNQLYASRKQILNHMNSRSLEMKTATRKDFVSSQRGPGLQDSRVEKYHAPVMQKIECLKNQNKHHKISLSRKRSAYLFTFDNLTNRVNNLKSEYIQQENRMAEISFKDQKDQKISRTTLAPPSRAVIIQ